MNRMIYTPKTLANVFTPRYTTTQQNRIHTLHQQQFMIIYFLLKGKIPLKHVPREGPSLKETISKTETGKRRLFLKRIKFLCFFERQKKYRSVER